MGIPDREESSRNRKVGWALIFAWKASDMIQSTSFESKWRNKHGKSRYNTQGLDAGGTPREDQG